MANHKSSLKRIRQNKKRNLRNRSLRSAYRTHVKNFVALIQDKKEEEIKQNLSFIHKVIDKACTKGILAKNTASRKKSKLTKMANQLSKA